MNKGKRKVEQVGKIGCGNCYRIFSLRPLPKKFKCPCGNEFVA